MNKLTVLCTVIVAVGCLCACKTNHRIKTHPDPDVRIESMRQTLELLENEDKESEQDYQQPGRKDDEITQHENQAEK